MSSHLDKPFACSWCKARFTRKEHKLRHEQSHSPRRYFQCSVCPKVFVRKDVLLRHLKSIHDSTLAMGTPKLVNPTARAQSGEPDESNVLVGDIEVTVPVETRPPICDGEIPLTHTETFSFSDLVGTPFNGSVLSEDLGFGFYNNDFDNLIDPSENDVLILSNSDGNAGDSSPGRTMDLVYHLEEIGSRTKPSNLALIADTDTFTRYQPITQGAQGPLQACWPTELAAQRYVRAFFGSFQRHISLLHIPTYLAHQPSEPLQFAIYAVGALYVYNGTEAHQLYRAGHEAFLAQRSQLVPLERLQTLLLQCSGVGPTTMIYGRRLYRSKAS